MSSGRPVEFSIEHVRTQKTISYGVIEDHTHFLEIQHFLDHPYVNFARPRIETTDYYNVYRIRLKLLKSDGHFVSLATKDLNPLQYYDFIENF